MRRGNRGRAALVALALFSGALSAPAVSATSSGRTEVRAGETEIWLRLDEMARLLVLRIESAAFPAAISSDPETRRSALLFQTNIATAVLAATSHPDPVIAYLDTWALAEQVRNLFDGPSGRERFGAAAEAIGKAAADASAGFGEAAATGVSAADLARARTLVEGWARAHPIEGPTFVRPSIVSELATTLRDQSWGAFEMAGRVGRKAEALESRLGLHAELLPRVLRWQARLAAEQEQLAPLIDRANRSLESLEKALGAENRRGEMARIFDELERRIERQRKAALEEAGTTASRLARQATAEALDDLFRRLADQTRLLDDLELRIDRQRRAALADAEKAAARVAREAAVAAIDEAFRRAWVLLGAAFGAALLLLLAWRLVPRRG